MATNINTPGSDGTGFVLGILLILVVVGFGAWAMGITPWNRQTNITVETSAPSVPAAPAPSSGNTNSTN